MKLIEVNGDRMPALGLGTWQLKGGACREAVRHALELGYRHIDTARMYGNEEAVGRGVRDSGVDRSGVWITSKIWLDALEHDAFLRSAEASLKALGTDYLDLLLIHWPSQEVPLDEPLAALKELAAQGKARHIGVSNFTPPLLEQALDTAPIVCNQVEYHPFLSQRRLLTMVQRHGLILTAYSPLARGRVPGDGTLREIGRHHGKRAAQVALRWLLQQERVAAIPRAASPEHRRQNLEVFDFELSAEEMAQIDDLARGERLSDPSFAPNWER